MAGSGYISVSINIDRDEQGKILRYYGANQDVTDRQLAELAVRRSEAELSQALQIAKLAYWEYDVEKDLVPLQRSVLLNLPHHRRTGRRLSTLVGAVCR